MSVKIGELPAVALLQKYRRSGAYTDCFFLDVPQAVEQSAFVESFCTTPLFKAERAVLGWLVNKPSTDLQARHLAAGTVRNFAAWRVEAQTPDQLLLCDFQGYTRSWLMSVAYANGRSSGTRLYFGSAVVPRSRRGRGKSRFGITFHALRGFHRFYSRALLRSAIRHLQA